MSVILLSQDQKSFEVSKAVANRSSLIKNMLEESPDSEEPVPLMDKSCKGEILEKVLEYLKRHQEFESAGTSAEEVKAFDAKFIEVDDDTLFGLILAANFLDIKSLLDLTCKAVADIIKKCKTPEEIRQRFKIEKEFTPEEVKN